MNIRTRGVQAVCKIGEVRDKNKQKGECSKCMYSRESVNIVNIVDNQ